MDEKLLSKKQKRLRHLFRVGLATGGLILFAIFGFIYLLVADIISFGPYSYVSVMNLGEENITVNNKKLEIFDTYKVETNVKRDYLVKNVAGDTLFNKTIPDRNGPKLSVYVRSLENYCFFSADVSSFYYQTDTLEDTLVNVSKLENTSLGATELKIDLDNYVYLYPGKYSTSDVPENLIGKKLIGVYPIKCELAEIPEAQKSIVISYKNFNSAQQREYYNNKVDELIKQL